MLPFDIDEISIDVSKHFRNTWMRNGNWDQFDLREALREASKVSRLGDRKWEVFVRKHGGKKLVIVYDAQTQEVFVITGAEG